ncbi:MAG: response regulator [Ardenticatenales bacterium]|nr:response regulator [Ardenticatenales bacterium]
MPMKGRVRNGILKTSLARLAPALLLSSWLTLGLAGFLLVLSGRITLAQVGIPLFLSFILGSMVALLLLVWVRPGIESVPPTAAETEMPPAPKLDGLSDTALIEAQRLESLGLLAGGIAHDFNNLLTGMLGHASLTQAMLEPDHPAQAQVGRMMATAGRAADLAQQLLAYAGKADPEISLLDLNQFLGESARLMETALPRRVELVVQPAPDLPLIAADRGQLQQLLMNLILNATEAMPPAGGQILISTQKQAINTESPILLADGSCLLAGHYVCLVVQDNGNGMDAATRDQIFDPFFTTKARGHGLGLSAALGIMQKHQGGIQVHSQPEQGTTFCLYFPAQRQRRRAAPVPVVSVGDLHGTVLIVDDDHDVRRVAADILSSQGMRVLEAKHGQAGLDCYQANQGAVDVVLLDVKMPVLDGEDTYRALKQMDPDARIIVSTGYGDADASALLEELGASEFLSKPYDFDALVGKMRAMVRG